MAALDNWAFRRMNIPERFWGVGYDRLPDIARAPVRAYCSKLEAMLRRGAGFYLYGSAGVGKTGIGVVLLKAAWERDRTGYFTTIKELRQAVRDEDTFDGSESVLARCKEVDVLVLDDLAPDDFKMFQFGIGEIEHLIASRAMRARTTILTTRLTPDFFRLEYSSILQTMHGSFVALSCTGPNLKEAEDASLRRELGVY